MNIQPLRKTSPIPFFLFILWLILSLSHATENLCFSEEKEALLEFKRGIQMDHCGFFSSWGNRKLNEGCCQWHGILCDNQTDHVIGINLSGAKADSDIHCLEGKVGVAILNLKHLKFLDLSFNNFQGQPIPTFLGSLANLKHLNLSDSGFTGEIPHEFGNLSYLTSLDLSRNKVKIKSLGWLSNMTSLSVINLSDIDLSEVRNWLEGITKLPFLKVLKMDGCNLSPTMPSSLTTYKNISSSTLHFLSLAHNNFSDASIFQWLFNLSSGLGTHLVHLDLSDNSLPGSIPEGFRNMHLLSYLDLSSNAFEGPIPNYFGNMHSLSHLDLSANLLNGTISSCFSNMQSLLYLDVSGNALDAQIPESISNLKHLIHLDLSWNNFQGRVPKTIGKLCSLQYLELSNNNLTDELPAVIEALSVCSQKSSLRFLSLENNHFWGSVPDAIKAFSSLRILYLDGNQLNGTISQEIAKLHMLESLHLSSSSLLGIISDNHLANLSRLSILDLSNNSRLLVNINVDWLPPFQLNSIYLSSCKLGPYFPKWLHTQTQISWIDISNAGISDIVPASFWTSLSSKLEYLNMSHNNIHGVFPSNLSITFDNLPQIDLSSNSMEGAIPSFLGSISSLSLNDNLFTDPIPFLCPKTKIVLPNLDLSNNLLSGELPDCWMYFDNLSILRLESNKLFGVLPASIGMLKRLQALHLRNNNFSGELPMSLQNCTSLVLVDAAYNSLSGYIPPMVGYHLKNLGILSLRSNQFHGVLPPSLCNLSGLQILDVSVNHISGNIPSCIHNLTAMITTSDLLPDILYQYDFSVVMSYYDAAFLMWKEKSKY